MTLEQMNRATHGYRVPGEDHLIDMICPDTGLTWINGETLEQIRERYPNAELVEIAALCQEKASAQDVPVTWKRVSKDRYWEMLEVLPPAYMGSGGFLVGEPWDHHALSGQPRFAAFIEKAGEMFYEASRPMTIREFKNRNRGEGAQ